MPDRDPLVTAALAAHADGRFAEALSLLKQLFAEEACATVSGRSRLFITMFGWQMLVAAYPPARAALQTLREAQIRQLLAGDLFFGPPGEPIFDEGRTRQTTRFAIVVDINRMIDEPASTATLFQRLDADQPALAETYAGAALPALVATGRFALADRYRGAPLRYLDAINFDARTMPLYPGAHEAPRLAASLSGLVGEVAIGMAVLEGLGRAAEARQLRAALLDGLQHDALRDLAARELAASGTITRTLVEHQMARDS
ncbi:hypothetical protein [Massilia sp. S19_KUP03_FR1]|uniref:hypothetical protein n=1 Tax=Massilia sp. S19_KUP03_FR1 TaxID=3025503 RepID=UPI002FCD8EB8